MSASKHHHLTRDLGQPEAFACNHQEYTMSSYNLRLTDAALANIEATGMGAIDVSGDVERVRDGIQTADGLLEECLDGADDDRAQGWRDYVEAVVAAA